MFLVTDYFVFLPTCLLLFLAYTMPCAFLSLMLSRVLHKGICNASRTSRLKTGAVQRTVLERADSPQVGARRAPLREKQATGLFFSAQTLSGFESPRNKKTQYPQKWILCFWPARRDGRAAALPCAACPRNIVASDFAAENVPLARFLNAAHPLRVRIPPNEKNSPHKK